jgi:hypothetical protein
MTLAGRSFKALQDEVLTFQFSETKYRPLVKTWLNDAQRKFAISSEIRTQVAESSITTVAADASYALPENYARFVDLYRSDSHELLTPYDLRDFDTLPASSGAPYGYSVRGGELFLYPTPDNVYSFTLRYRKLPADMVNDTDISEIPVQYQELLVSYAMWKAFLREDDFQAAQTWEAIWEKGLLKARGEVQADSFDGPRQVGGTWSDPHGSLGLNVWR